MSLRKGHEHSEDRTARCQWVRCRGNADIIYMDDGLCWEHWEKLCAQQAKRGDRVQLDLELVEVPG